MSRVILVTGGIGGIGTEICSRLSKDGFRVVSADIDIPENELGEVMSGQTKEVTLCPLDISDTDSVQSCVDHASKIGDLAGVVNCAGVLRHGKIADITEEGMKTVWDVNFAGMIRICMAASAHLKSGSSIVNISSVTASVGRLRGGGIYGASKAAMEAFTKYLAYELAPAGIRVNALAPGFIEVLPMSESMRYIASGDTDEAATKWLIDHIPMGRLGRPKEIAGPCSFLLSENASYITGHVLMADGGVVCS